MLIFFLFAVYLFVFSESGLIERIKLKSKFTILNDNINLLKVKNMELYSTYKNYNKGLYTPDDYLKSGYILSNGLILNFVKHKQIKQNRFISKDRLFNINNSHLRIIWIIISAMVLIFYFKIKKNGEELSDE